MNVISVNGLDIFIFGGFFGVTGSDGKSIVLSGAFKDKAALSRFRYSVENTVVFITVFIRFDEICRYGIIALEYDFHLCRGVLACGKIIFFIGENTYRSAFIVVENYNKHIRFRFIIEILNALDTLIIASGYPGAAAEFNLRRVLLFAVGKYRQRHYREEHEHRQNNAD